MNGWVLYKYSEQELTAADYGTQRLLEVANARGLVLNVHRPDEFDVVISEAQHHVVLKNERVVLPNVVIPRIGAETSHFALMLIRQLEALGVVACNSSDAIAMVKDKVRMGLLLAKSGLPTPKTMLVKFPVSVDLVKREIGFPLVVKNNSGAKGFGVYLCESAANFKDLMELMSSHAIHKPLIVQSFITNSYGRDLRVFVLGGRVIGCMKRTAKDSFKANYSLGGDVELYPLTDEIERLALDCARLFRLDIAGIDLLFDTDGFKVCEANSSPGFKGMELATGTDIAGKIMDHILSKMHP